MNKLFEIIGCGISVIVILMSVPSSHSQELTDSQKLEKINKIYKHYQKSFPETPDVSVEALISMKECGEIVIVDRRRKREQDVSKLPGAIASEQFERDIERYRDKTVVVYCTIGSRSGHYAKELTERGIKAYNLRGGILSWTHAGQKLVSQGKETRRVHVYGRKWNLVPNDYQAVW